MERLVIQTEELSEGPAAWLAERCRLERCAAEDPRFAGLLAGAEGLVVRTYTQVNEAMLEAAPRLKVVARAGVGLENIDVSACRARGVEVVYAPGANTRAVVEFVTALLMDALRSRERVTSPVSAAEWGAKRSQHMQNRQLDGLTLGILGLGRIGEGVARVAGALDMEVLYHDVRDRPEGVRHGARPVSFDELISGSDVLSIHVDSRRSNKWLMNAGTLARLRERAVIINTSRGFVVNPGDLALWLRGRPHAKAMLDVHDPHEPIGADYPLLGLPNAFLTHHIAAGTSRAKENMSWVVRDVWRVLNGESPEFRAPELA